ncbi:MAG TPA: TonB-dependent receptor, partial [Steroidobacteraceae bacterium]|nr:TonB-dependent receptor [Steroidobacteraceae bacterium]
MYQHWIARALFAACLGFIPCSTFADDAAPEHAEELETVVVTASPIGDPDKLATIAGSVDRAQLLRGGAATLADGLAQVAGVTSSGFAAGAGRPVIRGMDANRVRVLEDGIGSFDVSDVGPDHGVPIDPFTAERIEVVRGAATLRYGSQAIGGVVNAISQRVPTRFPGGPFTGEVTGGYSTGADSRDFAAQAGARTGDVAWHADAFMRHAGDYDTPDGVQTNSWLRGKGASLGGSWIGGDDRVGLGVIRTESRYGIPAEESYIDMHQTKLLLRSSFGLHAGAWRTLTVDGGWADYAHSERDDTGAALSTFRDREWDARAEVVAGQWGFLGESALGVQLQQRDFSALGEGRRYLLPTTTRNQAAFGFAEAPLSGTLRLQFGGRVEHVGIDGTAPDDSAVSRDFTPLSASVGLVLDLPEAWRLGLALSSAARAPAQTELFARGPHDGPLTYETGDPSLGMERANSIEASLRWRGDRVHADGALWATRFSNYIYGELTGQTCDEGGNCAVGNGQDLKQLFYAQRDARFVGAEAHAEVELLRHSMGDLHLNLLADVVRAELARGGGDVPRIPPYHLGAGLSWQGERLDASVFAKYAGRQSR